MRPLMKHGLAIFAAVIIVINVADSYGQTNIGSAPPDVEQAVLARLTEIQHAAEALDPDLVFSYVMENDRGALFQNGEFLRTRGAALEATKRAYADLQQVSFGFYEQHVVLLAPTVALVTGTGTSSATIIDGRAFTGEFVQSVILVLDEGEWKVFHAHRSFPPGR